MQGEARGSCPVGPKKITELAPAVMRLCRCFALYSMCIRRIVVYGRVSTCNPHEPDRVQVHQASTSRKFPGPRLAGAATRRDCYRIDKPESHMKACLYLEEFWNYVSRIYQPDFT